MTETRDTFWVEPPSDAAALGRMKRLVNVIAVVAVLDALLLGVLLWASFTDQESLITPLGATHGFGFITLVGLCLRGVGEDWWGWWFPALVVVTGGPVGSLVGDLRVRRAIGD